MEREIRKGNSKMTMGTFAEAFDEMPTSLGAPAVSTRTARTVSPTNRPAPAPRVSAKKPESGRIVAGPAAKPGRKVAVNAEALLVLRDGKLAVHDLGVADGILLNGERVRKLARVGLGDRLRVGGFEIRLGEPQPSAIPAPAAEAEIDPSFLRSDEDVIDPEFLRSDDEPAADEESEESDEPVAVEEVDLGDDEDEDDEEVEIEQAIEADADEADAEDAPGARSTAEREPVHTPRGKRILGLAVALSAVIVLGFASFVFAGRKGQTMPSFDDLLAPALAALHQGNFEGAVQEFTRLEEMYPESKVSTLGIEVARLFRSETDPFLFDWAKAGDLYKKMGTLDEAGEELKTFAQQQTEWVQREKACAELIYQAQEHVEKKDLENALALYEQIEKDYENSDLRMAVKADLVKLRVQLRKDYVGRAEKELEGKVPDWTSAIADYEKALKYFGQSDPEIADALSACKRNFEVKVKLAHADAVAKSGKLDEALIELDRVEMGSHYDRALLTLKTNVANEKMFQQALGLYRRRDARGALDLLAGQSEERATTLGNRIRKVVAELEDGKRLCSAKDYVEALPHLEAVRKAESDNGNPYLQEAGQLHKLAAGKIRELAEESFSRGMQALDDAHYLEAADQLKRLAKVDTDGSLTDKVRRRVEMEAGKLMKDVKGHFWTSTPTEADQVVLDLLIRYLGQENSVRQEALRFKNNLEEAKLKDGAKASVIPKR